MSRTRITRRPSSRRNPLPQGPCLWNFDPNQGYLSCKRISLPGRLVCHKHANQVAAIRRRRARRKAS